MTTLVGTAVDPLRDAKAAFGVAVAERQQCNVRLLRAVERVETTQARLDRLIQAHRLHNRVLVVDDDQGSLWATAQTVRHALPGIVVDEANTAQLARALWSKHRHAVVVTDLLLGRDSTGVDLLLALGRGPKGVLVTGVTDPVTLRRLASISDAIPRVKPLGDIARLVSMLLADAVGNFWLGIDGASCTHASALLAVELGIESSDNLLGRRWEEFVAPSSRASFLRALVTAREESTQVTVTAPLVSAERGLIPMSWSIHPMGGEYCHCVARTS